MFFDVLMINEVIIYSQLITIKSSEATFRKKPENIFV